LKPINTIIKIVLSLLFIGALFKMPYSYYELMRFNGMIGFGILGYKAFEKENKTFIVIWFASALLINPFFKLVLGRFVWNVIDVVWICILLFSIYYERKIAIKKRESDLIYKDYYQMENNLEKGNQTKESGSSKSNDDEIKLTPEELKDLKRTLAIRITKDPTFAKKVMDLNEEKKRELADKPTYLTEAHRKNSEAAMAQIAEWQKSPPTLEQALKNQRKREE